MQKLIISLIAVIILSIITLGWGMSVVYSNIHQKNEHRNKNHIELIESIGINLATTLDQSHNCVAFVESWNRQQESQISVLEKDELPVPEALMKSLYAGKPVLLQSEHNMSFYFPLNRQKKIMAMEFPVTTLESDENILRLALTMTFYVGLIVVLLIWVYPLIQRLSALRHVANRLGSGDLSSRANTSGFTYIGDIESEFNRMADRIQNLIDDNKLLSRAVSHDLKTPLARLRFGIETLAECQDAQQREKYHQHIEKDLTEMESLVSTLLQFARLEEAHININMDTCDLAALVRKSMDTHSEINGFVSATLPNECLIHGDAKYLLMLVNNLVQNALEHCDQRVSVSLTAGEKIQLDIEDDGKGILPEERDYILTPFVRGKNESKKQGHGMGLAIVNRIAKWHEAELEISDSGTLGGAKVSVRFTALKPENT